MAPTQTHTHTIQSYITNFQIISTIQSYQKSLDNMVSEHSEQEKELEHKILVNIINIISLLTFTKSWMEKELLILNIMM